MIKTERGCVMPYAVKRMPRLILVGIWILMAAYSVVSLNPAFQSIVNSDDSHSAAIRITTLLTIPMVIPSVAACFVQLNLLPEEIVVKLFGMTFRRIAADEIRFLTAVQYSRKIDAIDCIAVCLKSYETMCEISAPKLLQNIEELWEGEWVYKHLAKRASWFVRDINLNQNVLWLDWSPERLMLLRKMYPQAQWLDCSSDKLFDKQLNS